MRHYALNVSLDAMALLLGSGPSSGCLKDLS